MKPTFRWRLQALAILGIGFGMPTVLATQSMPSDSGKSKLAKQSGAQTEPRRIVITDFRDYAARERPIPNTLRWAIEVLEGPRLITFDAAGVIDARQDKLHIKQPHITLDGGKDGVTINGAELGVIGTHHVTLRQLRVRESAGKSQARIDAEARGGGLRSILICDSQDVLVEHCSAEDSTDDNVSIWNYNGPACRAVRISYCIIAGGATFKIGKGTPFPDAEPARDRPTKGLLAGAGSDPPRPPAPPADAPDWLTIDHCLFIDCYSRVPQLSGRFFTFYNNLVVQETWAGGGLDDKSAGDIVNNWFDFQGRDGAQWEWKYVNRPISVGKWKPEMLHVAGNLHRGKPFQPVGLFNRGKTEAPPQIFRRRPFREFQAEPADVAFRQIIAKAGCRPLDKRDSELIRRVAYPN